MTTSEAQVKIKFFTKESDASLHVSEAPLFAPVSLKRFGISEIINYLLQKEGEHRKPIPFDILINDVLLTTSLDDYLTKNGLSNEVLLTLEYKKASLPPSLLTSYSNDDWISSISISKTDGSIMTGSYDGVVRIWNGNGEVERQFSGHSAPIKSVKWISDTRAVSGGNDRGIRLWKMKKNAVETGVEEAKTVAILEGHKSAVSSLAVSAESNRILSGGYDGIVNFWSTVEKEMAAVTIEHDSMANNLSSSAAKKRRKLALGDQSIKRRMPLMSLDSHKQPVESVIFAANDNTVAYSVSQDHSIKTWDLVTGRVVSSASTGFSLLCCVELPGLLACGTSGRHIITYDPRVESHSITRQLIGHKGFVVDLAASPTSDFELASASSDGTVKMWDIRGDKCLHSLSPGKGKLFAVDWDKNVGIVSGGEDKKIAIYGESS